MTATKILFLFLIIICINSAQATSWNVNGLKLSTTNQSLIMHIEELSLSLIAEKINNIKYQCLSSHRIYPVHTCDNGNVSFKYLNTYYNFQFKGWFDFINYTWDVDLTSPKNTLSIHHTSETQDSLTVSIRQLPVTELLDILKDQISIDQKSIEGIISAELELNFSQLFTIIGSYQLESFNWESESSEYVLADTKIIGEFALNPFNNGYQLLNTTSIEAGEGLFKDIYLVFEKELFVVNSVLTINKDFKLSDLELYFELTKSNTITINKINLLNFDLNQLNLNIDFDINDISILYEKFLKSFLSILGISNAEFDGKVNGQINFKEGQIKTIKAKIDDLFMEIGSKKIEVNNLSANIDWHNQGDFLPSTFKWDALLLAGMPINKSQLQVMTSGQEIQVKDNTQIPIFDGSVDIKKLSLSDIFQSEYSIQFNGEVQPISLALISEKMGWPVMNGTISGIIPGMQKLGDIIKFDGLLELNLFDGTMQIEGLSIERLFGIAPVIAADLKFQNLSLLQLTSTFDFGEITGRINGYVNRMRITNWQPDRLDAYIESVKTKGVKQLISQRAIDNISSIGGIQGALSRSFLRFFDAFKYKKIGIGCKLRNSICEMKGIKTTVNNYQIVEGSGLPSINIFGYRKFIDWKVFLDRLLNANY